MALTKQERVKRDALFAQGLKQCSKCGEIKPLDTFSRDRRKKDGLQSRCNACNRNYYEMHKEQIAARQYQYAAMHKEQIAARGLKYRITNKERIDRRIRERRATPEGRAARKASNARYAAAHKKEKSAYDRKYRVANIERITAYRRKYNDANKEKLVARSRKHYAEHKRENAMQCHEYYELNKEGIKKRVKKWAMDNPEKVKSYSRLRQHRIRAGGSISTEILQEIEAASNGMCPYCGEPIVGRGHYDHIIPVSAGVSNGGTNDRENLVYVCAHCNLSKNTKSLDDFMAHTGRLALIPKTP